MATVPKYIELVDKENSAQGAATGKKDKLAFEELPIKKTVLGESSQPKVIEDEPSSPNDTKLINRKR